MNERMLAKISLVGFLICLSLLYFLTLGGFYHEKSIGEIEKANIGETVNVTGEISGLFTHDGHVFFDLYDGTGKIKVVLWEDTIDVMKEKGIDMGDISDGKRINVIGNVQLYMGELELLPIHGVVHVMG